MAKRGFRIATPRQSTLNRSVREGLAPKQLRILTPWEGFTPDVSYHGLDPTGTSGWRGLMVWGEFLLTRDGFEAMRDTTGEIQVGFTNAASNFNEGTLGATASVEWATGSRATTTASQPIAVIGWFLDDRTNPARRQAFIISHTRAEAAAGSTTGAPFPEYNTFLLRRIDHNEADTWGTIPFIDSANTPVLEDSPPRWTTDQPIDWAVWPLPIPGFTITEPFILFCSRYTGKEGSVQLDGGQSVMVFPSIASATNYTSMAVAAAELEAAATASGVSQDAAVISGIQARSVTVFDGRAMYLNIAEDITPAGPVTDRARRVRWSAIGHPFLLDPGYENSAGTVFGVGAGFMDLDEWQGEGVRIEVIGRTAVAAYMDTGVAFLRRTGQPEQAFEREIISMSRGLLATRALANIGQGLHFGIFTDGWFFLDENGQWSEVGLAKGTKEGQTLYKWKETFYTQLIREETHKLVVAYDPLRKMIQVAWPAEDAPDGSTSELNTIWYYDLTSDRVYEDTYVEDYASDMTPRVWGVTPPEIHEPAGGTPAAVVTAYDRQAADRVVIHGSDDGRLYAQSVVFHQYDFENIEWDFELKDTAFGLDPFVIKTIDRMWFEYETVGNNLAAGTDACTSFTVVITSDSGVAAATQTVTLQTQTAPAGGEIRIAQLSLRQLGAGVVGHRFLIEFEGSGNVKLLSMRVQILVAEERGIGSHSKESAGTAI